MCRCRRWNGNDKSSEETSGQGAAGSGDPRRAESTRALTNSAGSITDTYSYTAFGELLNQTGTTANNYLYTGQQFDTATGLYDLRARYYNPGLGRFLSQDTYAVNFSNPVELNRYVYTGNNPISLVDPTGHNALEYGKLSFLAALTTKETVVAATFFAATIVVISAVNVLLPYVQPKIWDPKTLPEIKSLEDINRLPPIWQRPSQTPNPNKKSEPKPTPGGTPPPPLPLPLPTPENSCPEGSHRITWPASIWKSLGIGDSGATNGLFDGPNSGIPRILTKIRSPEREPIGGPYKVANWGVLKPYYEPTRRGELHHKWPLFLGGSDTIGNLVFLPINHHMAWHAMLYSQGVTGYRPKDPNGTVYCVVN